MKKLLKEPLIHFLLMGGGLFLLYSFLNPSVEQVENNIILIDNSDAERLIKAYQQIWSTPPDSATLTKLLEEEVKAEVLYREALRMKLDHNDEIIRRRLKQKYEFLVKDLADNQQPKDEELKRFYEEHSDLYQAPAKLSFTHIYFSPDKRSLPLQNAQNTFEEISNLPIDKVDVKKIGDPFHLQSYFADRDYNDVRQLLGQDFAKGLFNQIKEGWLSPIKSGYGIHLVYVSNIQKEHIQPYDIIKDRVLEDLKLKQQQVYNARLYENLLEKYEVVYELEK
jgi:peptidyl-prolyl cis-trans isomerase C